jgi:hypothetical protein
VAEAAVAVAEVLAEPAALVLVLAEVRRQRVARLAAVADTLAD